MNYTYSTNLSSLTFLASFQQQVQPDADLSHMSEIQYDDVPDITHISETNNLLITHISETHQDSTKLSKYSGNYKTICTNIFIY